MKILKSLFYKLVFVSLILSTNSLMARESSSIEQDSSNSCTRRYLEFKETFSKYKLPNSDDTDGMDFEQIIQELSLLRDLVSYFDKRSCTPTEKQDFRNLSHEIVKNIVEFKRINYEFNYVDI